MGIVIAMIISIFIKAISAVLEIAIQMLITNKVGVNAYGEYSFFVSLIGAAYYLLFSGNVKLNTFYLSTKESTLSKFKKKYNCFYVLPVIGIIEVVFIVVNNWHWVLAGFILLLYYFAFDRSSVFFARGQQLPALLGEYFLCRMIFLILLIIALRLEKASGMVLLALYGSQFITIIFWLSLFNSRIEKGSEEVEVPFRKLFEYQVSDIANSFITYSHTILQFIFGGAFTAGFTGIVSIVKKFINFISGPTAKVFLPEFSRLYKNGDIDQLEKSYLMIVRIQMVFIGTIGALLICFPRFLLHMFSSDLEQYTGIFTATAICLLVISGIGPVTGMLQMTGNERICNRNQWISIGMMIAVWFVFHKQSLFAVYGLCTQAVVEGIMKYYSVCRWFGKNIIPIKNYLLLWFPVIVLKIFVEFNSLQMSIVALTCCTFAVLLWNTCFAMRDPMVKSAISNLLKK